jgi:Transposase DDE domain
MLNQPFYYGWRRPRIIDSVRCGLDEGGRNGGDGASWGIFGPAAAKKGQQLLERLVCQRTVTIKRLGKDEAGAKGFSRFLRNEQVTEQELIASAKAHLLRQVAGRRVLAIQDTSEINFSRQRRRKQAFGRGGNGTDPAFFIHPILVVDADSGLILGVVDVQVWERHAAADSQTLRETDDKESRRWLIGAQAAACLRDAGAVEVTVIADREGDTYAAFARRPHNVDLLVRAQTDRCLADGGHLFNHLDSLPIVDQFVLDLPAIPGRAARRATMVLRFGPVSLRPPRKSVDRDLPPSVELYALDVREIDAPEGVEPVHWRLLSSAPIASVETAHHTIAAYRKRWLIEQLFRTLKTQGLGLEESQIESPQVLRKLALIALRAAVICMQLVRARDGADQRPATAALDNEDIAVLEAVAPTVDGKTERLKNPFQPQSLAWAAWIIARLGGWNGAKNAKPPGPITMHRGLQCFHILARGFRLANVSTP